MEKTTKNDFSKKLAQYGALSLAIAGVADASGQIVYTDVDPDFVGGAPSSFAIDFDGDGTVDVTILQMNNGAYELVQALPAAGNGVIAMPNAMGAYAYASNLMAGDVINSAAAFMSFGSLCAGPGYAGSNFCGTTGGFVGIQFVISGTTYYGWVGVDVVDSSNFTVRDYAYNSTPGEAINAGQTLGVEESELSRIKIVAMDNTISLFNLPQNMEYNLYSMTGKLVMNGSINQSSYVIEAKSMASGIYVIELNDVNTNATVKKKIVL